MKIKWKSLLAAVLIPLAVGGLSALLSGSGMTAFAQMNKPPLSPPAWLFPVVWTILFLMMGVASYFVRQSKASTEQKRTALTLYAVQLFFNFFWSIIFFQLEQYLLAFFWLLALWLLIYLMLHEFMKCNQKAGLMLLPYLAWVIFAGYLNLGIYLLN